MRKCVSTFDRHLIPPDPFVVVGVLDELPGIFRFAETVSLDSFSTANKTKLVGDRIAANLLLAASTAPSASPPLAPAPPAPAPAPAHDSAHQAQYRVIESTSSAGGRGPRRTQLRPPVVTSASATPAPPEYDPFTIYDAVQDLPDAPPLPGRPARILDSHRGPPQNEDDIMNTFVPMLQEYLTLQQSAPSLPTPSAQPAVEETAAMEEDSSTDDLVYDVYYRDLRELAGASDVATLAGLQRIGALAGIVDDDLLSSELSSEDEDEADQDSNEENDYRNDYPSGEEEESDDSWRGDGGGSDDD
ncbi:hypothetical protein RQP46_011344 [Phenoliferia psychrophenolica]